MGTPIEVDGLEKLYQTLNRLANVEARGLLSEIGGIVESQTRARIEEEQIAPNGTVWPEWSVSYEKTRHDNHNLLQNSGMLVDSIESIIGHDSVEVGTNRVYAPIHQYGDETRAIPARPFLGVSDDNMQEIRQLLGQFANTLLET